MCRHEIIESLRDRLIQRGLPVPYVQHAMNELHDHYMDARDAGIAAGLTREVAEQAAANALGGIDQLESQFTRQARPLIIVHRHPWLTFAVTPVVALILSWMVLVVLHIVVARTAAEVPRAFYTLEIVVFYAVAHLVSPALAVVMVRLAVRWSAGIVRPLVACVVLSLLGGTIHVCTPGSVSLPESLNLAVRLSLYLAPIIVLADYCYHHSVHRASRDSTLLHL